MITTVAVVANCYCLLVKKGEEKKETYLGLLLPFLSLLLSLSGLLMLMAVGTGRRKDTPGS